MQTHILLIHCKQYDIYKDLMVVSCLQDIYTETYCENMHKKTNNGVTLLIILSTDKLNKLAKNTM